jgi:hypothetical protein
MGRCSRSWWPPADLPDPLWRVEAWARAWAVEEVFGIQPTALTDDRIGRALDAIAPSSTGWWVGRRAGDRCLWPAGGRAALARTSISLSGADEDPSRVHRVPVRPSQGPPTRAQAAPDRPWGSGDGGVPVVHQADHGGAGEVAQVAEAIPRLGKPAGPRRLLPVVTPRLVSSATRRDIMAARVGGIAPASKTSRPAEVPTRPAAARRHPGRLGGRARRRQGPDPARQLPGGGGHHDHRRPAHHRSRALVRRVLVWSSARAGAAATAGPARWTAPAPTESGSPAGWAAATTDAHAVAARLATIARSRRVTALRHAEVGATSAARRPHPAVDQTALEHEQATDGRDGC